ncbi:MULTISPECIES: RHS repeat-associated core domain-containing protein [unclassified Allomuricauda]|uniref:RHS repeat-associated core domain-containing protein n=1 Tax=unclassified Allomuricauda TaxID=2615049 RepID=UPI00273D761B|nr:MULTISPECIES: RHS repeat-associated core domain-containing protein [unclassified Allomuricauda]
MKDDNHANLEGYTDYYPFGMPMPNRTLSGAEGYRYAFQGQEKDPETGKEAFQLRLWDSRIGRWLTTDPYGQYASPYLGMGNDPINGIDPDGGWKWKLFAKWARNKAVNAGLNPGELYKSNGEWGFNTSSGGEVFNPHVGGLQYETSVTFNYTGAWKNTIPAQITPLTGINNFQMWRQAAPENNWDAIKHVGAELTFGTADNVKVLLTGSHFGNGPWFKGSIPNNSDAGVDGLVTVATLGYGSTFKKGLETLDSSVDLYRAFSKATKGQFTGPNHATLRSKAYRDMIRQHNIRVNNNDAVKQFKDFDTDLSRAMELIIQDTRRED